MKEIRDAIPTRLFVRDTHRSLAYFTRDIMLASICATATFFSQKVLLGITPSSTAGRLAITLAWWLLSAA
jgi:hypothetical protein